MPEQNTHEAFARQLKDGHFNELRVALHFMLQGGLTRISFTQGRYDIEVRTSEGRSFHVEVKWDKVAEKTGNLYFEFENTRQRRPSGIRATNADLWCHVVGDGRRAFLVEVPRLRQILEEGGFRVVRTGGADSNSRGILVPERALAAHSAVSLVALPTVEDFFGAVFRAGTRSQRPP